MLRIPAQFNDAQLLMVKPDAPYEAIATAFPVSARAGASASQDIRGQGRRRPNFTREQSGCSSARPPSPTPEPATARCPQSTPLELELYLKSGDGELSP
jgi:hypothetical protein